MRWEVLDATGSVKNLAGPTGPSGATGYTGLDGLDGVDGIDGLVGPTGPQGAPGPTGSAGFTIFANTDTGTKNDWIPTGSTGISSLIEWAGTGDLIVTGLASGVSGQSFYFKNTNAATGNVAYFSPSNTGSSSTDRLTNLITSSTTPVAGGGWIQYVWDGTTWKIIDHNQGAPINVAYASGNFDANGVGTWTVDSGDVATWAYMIHAKTIVLFVTLATTTTSGCGAYLRVLVPNSYTIAKTTFQALDYFGTDPRGIGSLQVNADGHIYFSKVDQSSWSDGTNNTAIRGVGQGLVT